MSNDETDDRLNPQSRWTVWRQGEDGNPMPVRDGLTEEEADRLAAEMESHGHKQLYWKERDRANRDGKPS